MTDPSKKVNNPLFNASVTGGTFEEFSQNAFLHPVSEKPPPVLSIPQDLVTEPQTIEKTALEPVQSTFETFENHSQYQYNPNINYEPSPDLVSVPQLNIQNPSSNSQTNNNFSSVFSSFSNILKFGVTSSNQPPEEFNALPPAGLETFISQENQTVAPVPLFNPIEITNPLSQAPTNKAQANTYRRSGLKRPTYAPVPGLSNQQPVNSFPPQQPPLLPTKNPTPSTPVQNLLTLQEPVGNTPSISPASSHTSSLNLESLGQTDHFKPISPAPTSGNIPQQISQPFPTVPQLFPANSPQIIQNFLTDNSQVPHLFPANQSLPFTGLTSVLQSPVMAAIPASEIMAETNINPPTITTTNSSNTGSYPANITSNQVYRPVYNHWFHRKEVEGKTIWTPFSMVDSLALEVAFTSNDLDPDKVVSTDGGRYDVNILRRQRLPVYWKGSPTEVRRCSWFQKGKTDGRYAPYEENVATKLEEEYKIAFETNQWHRKVELVNGETVVMHGPDVLVLLPASPSPDAWGNTPNQVRPRIVKRGMDEFDIDDGEPAEVDHLLFMVHGIGSVCDLKFRTVEEVVDEFRSIAFQLVQSHYRSSCERGIANRVEVLPISWHDYLHSEDTGIDRKLKSITLESIPRLRNFTNDTILDVLFYTSPVYSQTIISVVGNEMNRIYDLFKQRNPTFKGGVSLGGHSLGSLILFDLLGHQHPTSDLEPDDECEKDTTGTTADVFPPINETKTRPPPLKRRMSRRISYMMGVAGTGQPQIHYPHLNFQPSAFFALGSPIGMFVTVRGLDTLGDQFSLPTCPAFFNIFHPYDPVAYRVESLINSELANLKPVLIPHHKGRKRMHLELKDTMARVGADLKQKVIDSMKSTWNSFYQLAMFHRVEQEPSLEEEVNKAFREKEEQLKQQMEEPEEVPMTDLSFGILNKGRRIDYVLQEAPFEFFNEYIFALTSHVCYWESEDTILLMLKEIYSSMNVTTDSQIPQQTMTIERPSSIPVSLSKSYNFDSPNNFTPNSKCGMDPTAPIQQNTCLGPPPTAGFVKKT